MSNTRRPKPDPVRQHLDNATAALSGQRVPGGCDTCDAYQTLRRAGEGVYLIAVHHDDWCPVLARMNST
jgi:hypothetical protein